MCESSPFQPSRLHFNEVPFIQFHTVNTRRSSAWGAGAVTGRRPREELMLLLES